MHRLRLIYTATTKKSIDGVISETGIFIIIFF